MYSKSEGTIVYLYKYRVRAAYIGRHPDIYRQNFLTLEQLMKNVKQLIEQDINQYYLTKFLERVCNGLDTDPDEVKNNLLTHGNILDVSAGLIPARTLRAHIELWIHEGKKKINFNEQGS